MYKEVKMIKKIWEELKRKYNNTYIELRNLEFLDKEEELNKKGIKLIA